jgi:predicted dithiol-disulfide oxidoreductase (DUF899 family)
MQHHRILSRDEWFPARRRRLSRDREIARRRDQLSAERPRNGTGLAFDLTDRARRHEGCEEQSRTRLSAA